MVSYLFIIIHFKIRSKLQSTGFVFHYMNNLFIVSIILTIKVYSKFIGEIRKK
jgi:hypothetical protein